MVSRKNYYAHTHRYEYDADGLPAAIRINDNDLVNIGRNLTGQLISENLGGKITRSYGYDPAGNLNARSDSHKGPHRFAYEPMETSITESHRPYGAGVKINYCNGFGGLVICFSIQKMIFAT